MHNALSSHSLRSGLSRANNCKDAFVANTILAEVVDAAAFRLFRIFDDMHAEVVSGNDLTDVRWNNFGDFHMLYIFLCQDLTIPMMSASLSTGTPRDWAFVSLLPAASPARR